MEHENIIRKPIWEKFMAMAGGNQNIPIWDRYKGLVILIVVVGGFIATWTLKLDGISRSGEQVKVNVMRIEKAEQKILEIEKFIAAQAEINGQLKEMKTDLKSLTNYLLNNNNAAQ